MTIVNRRNAVLGWAVWRIGKRVAKNKAKAAVPGRVEGTNRPNLPAIVSAALAALAGVLVFWRRARSDEEAA